MKNTFMLGGIALLCFASAACSSDPISPANDKKEEYVREFVTNFGVPAADHNYAMARTAGLKVITKKGGHVTVTAEVGGKDYLFADLDVPAGTHRLPVTIPASVRELKVSAGRGIHTVSTDATVDIDAAPAGQGRSYYEVIDTDNDSEMTFEIREEGGDPYLMYEPQLSTDFFNQIAQLLGAPGDNTDPNVPTVIETTAYDQPTMHFRNNPHETALTCHGGSFDYYIFPIYWKTNKKGNKDYQVYFHKVREGENEISSLIPINFYDDDKKSLLTWNPFPDLMYTTANGVSASVNPIDKDYLKPGSTTGERVKFLTSYGNTAFPTSGNNPARLVLTRGKKIHMERYTDENKNHYFPRLAIAVESQKSGSFVSSVPFYNTSKWGDSYYDVPLGRLWQATVGTKRAAVLPRKDGMPVIKYVYDPELDISKTGKYGSQGEWINATSSNRDVWHNATPYFLGLKVPDSPFFLGFCSQPDGPADGSDRQYDEVVFFVTPHVNYREGVSLADTYSALPPAMEWTLAAEDLGGSFDWDFNDVVFSFTDVIRNLKSANKYSGVSMISGPNGAQSVRVITVTPKAAGGTMPVYITYTGRSVQKMPEMAAEGETMFSEANAALKAYMEQAGEEGTFVLGAEVHKWLGAASHKQPLNTGSARNGMKPASVEFVLPTDLDLNDERHLDYTNAVSDNNKTLFGFAVLVDKDDELKIDTFNDTDKGFRIMPSLSMGSGSYLIGRPSDNTELTAPQMILVQGDWEWPSERTNIKEAYPSFASWIENPDAAAAWIDDKNPGKVTSK